jgi:hypothetical protein
MGRSGKLGVDGQVKDNTHTTTILHDDPSLVRVLGTFARGARRSTFRSSHSRLHHDYDLSRQGNGWLGWVENLFMHFAASAAPGTTSPHFARGRETVLTYHRRRTRLSAQRHSRAPSTFNTNPFSILIRTGETNGKAEQFWGARVQSLVFLTEVYWALPLSYSLIARSISASSSMAVDDVYQFSNHLFSSSFSNTR